jgi:hypothetical protein
MRKSGSGVREPAGQRLRPSYFLFPAPAGGEKAKLGGELRREERLISRTGMGKDRVGTVDDLSEGVFHLPSPPQLRHDRSRIGAEASHVRLDPHQLAGLADQRPRTGASRASWRLVTFYISYYIIQKNIRIDQEIINTWLRVCFRRYRYCQWRCWDKWFTV